MKANFCAFVVLLFGCYTTSCGNRQLVKRLNAQQYELSKETVQSSIETRELVDFDWADAVIRMEKYNPSLVSAKKRIEDQERRIKSRWKNYLPSPSGTVSLRASLFNLGEITSDDIVASVFAPLRVPNPIDEYANNLQEWLQLLRAEDAYLQRKRQTTISLYALFTQWEEFENQINRDQSKLSFNVSNEIEALISNKKKEFQIETRKSSFYQQASELFDLPGKNIRCNPDTIPSIDYSERLETLEPGKNYGLLAIRLASYEIEASLLRLKGVKVRQWPRITNSVSIPTLFNSRNESNRFDVDSIRLFSGFSKSFDLTGGEARQVKTAKDNVQLVRSRLRLRMAREARQWQTLTSSYRGVLLELDLLESRLRRLKAVEAPHQTISKFVSEVNQLASKIRNLRKAKNRLDQRIWLWDDGRWKE